MMDYTFRRGDICWFNDPVPVGPGTFITHGRHPALVVSGDGGNINGDTVIIAPMTSNVVKRIYPGQFDISFAGRRSRVRCDQLRVVDKTTLETPVARLAPAAFGDMDKALLETLGIAPSQGFAQVNIIKEDTV